MNREANRSARVRNLVTLGALVVFLLFDAALAMQLLRDRDAGTKLETERTQEISAALSEVEQQRQRASDLTDQAEAIVAEFANPKVDRPKADPSSKPEPSEPRPTP